MKRPTGVILGSALAFPSKAKARKHFSDMLARYDVGDTVQPQDAMELGLLLLRHESADEKIGVGVDSFMVVRPDGYEGKCFGLRRVDGTATHFSYLHCLAPYTKKTTVMRAAREAVEDTIHSVRAKAFDSGKPVVCEVSGVPVTWDTAHVDHASPTFAEIVDRWRGNRTWDEIEVVEGLDVFGDRFAERERRSFRSFHDAVATLRIVAAKVNCGQLRRRVSA